MSRLAINHHLLLKKLPGALGIVIGLEKVACNVLQHEIPIRVKFHKVQAISQIYILGRLKFKIRLNRQKCLELNEKLYFIDHMHR